MKFHSPATSDLSHLYYELGRLGAPAVGRKKKGVATGGSPEELVILASDWSRWDPRLLQIIVTFGWSHWKEWNPYLLRQARQEMKTPQTVGVVSSFILAVAGDHQPQPDRELTSFWNYVTADLKPVSPQYYFFDLYLPGDHLGERAARESLGEFKRWGFLGRDRIVVNTATKTGAGSWDQPSRLNILKRLLTGRRKIQISEYLEELHHSISRQQALLDLKNLPARSKGEGRSAYWVLPPSKGDSPKV
ncbi:MAG: hypothetical protein Q7S00_04795 [bacterium]|nr:hypothetical protein [bacterium]